MEGESGTVVIRLCAAVLHCRSQGDGPRAARIVCPATHNREWRMLVGSLVREAEAAPSCDELREQQVDDDHGQDGDGDHHVHLAHIELQEVCTAQLRDQDGLGISFCSIYSLNV